MDGLDLADNDFFLGDHFFSFWNGDLGNQIAYWKSAGFSSDENNQRRSVFCWALGECFYSYGMDWGE